MSRHELVEIGFVADGVLDFFGNVGRGMVLQSNHGGTLHADAMLAQLMRELVGVFAFQLGVLGVHRFQAHPDPRHTQLNEFLHRVLANRVCRSEYRQAPAFSRGFHAFQQLHGAHAMQQEVFIHHKKRLKASISSNSSSPLSLKLWNLPLPPKNEDVVQKLHPRDSRQKE